MQLTLAGAPAAAMEQQHVRNDFAWQNSSPYVYASMPCKETLRKNSKALKEIQNNTLKELQKTNKKEHGFPS